MNCSAVAGLADSEQLPEEEYELVECLRDPALLMAETLTVALHIAAAVVALAVAVVIDVLRRSVDDSVLRDYEAAVSADDSIACSGRGAGRRSSGDDDLLMLGLRDCPLNVEYHSAD